MNFNNSRPVYHKPMKFGTFVPYMYRFVIIVKYITNFFKLEWNLGIKFTLRFFFLSVYYKFAVYWILHRCIIKLADRNVIFSREMVLRKYQAITKFQIRLFFFYFYFFFFFQLKSIDFFFFFFFFPLHENILFVLHKSASPRYVWDPLFKTTMSLVILSLITLIIKYGIYACIFCWKNVSSLCICKSYSHFFSKNTCELNIVLTRTVNILTTNELVKLTMLWITGPWWVPRTFV